jgi:3-hydroxyacyl-[acyl-carrier protein] dehydratase / trans-2-decenoyl-[acyl-carrier protein] isomerase
VPNPHDFHTPQPSYTKDELLRSSEGGYFGPGNAQLPAPPMLMMDRITEISLDGGEFGKGHIVGELDIAPGHWFFECHFRDDAMMPGSLGLDAMWQMIGLAGMVGLTRQGPRHRRRRGGVHRHHHTRREMRAL